jgi:hypothetical protein
MSIARWGCKRPVLHDSRICEVGFRPACDVCDVDSGDALRALGVGRWMMLDWDMLCFCWRDHVRLVSTFMNRFDVSFWSWWWLPLLEFVGVAFWLVGLV